MGDKSSSPSRYKMYLILWKIWKKSFLFLTEFTNDPQSSSLIFLINYKNRKKKIQFFLANGNFMKILTIFFLQIKNFGVRKDIKLKRFVFNGMSRNWEDNWWPVKCHEINLTFFWLQISVSAEKKQDFEISNFLELFLCRKFVTAFMWA